MVAQAGKGNDELKADPRLLQMAEENPDAIFMVIVQKEAKNKDLKEMDARKTKWNNSKAVDRSRNNLIDRQFLGGIDRQRDHQTGKAPQGTLDLRRCTHGLDIGRRVT